MRCGRDYAATRGDALSAAERGTGRSSRSRGPCTSESFRSHEADAASPGVQVTYGRLMDDLNSMSPTTLMTHV